MKNNKFIFFLKTGNIYGADENLNTKLLKCDKEFYDNLICGNVVKDLKKITE